ncbi:MAG: hypothetical protein WCA37_04380 [Terracidiphilus sp.]
MHSDASAPMPTGPAAAALLAAGIGSLALALFAIAADRLAALKLWMTFYRPTGPLSGVTTSAIALWLAAWAILHFRWRARSLALGPMCAAAFMLFLLGLLLTFPPLADRIG